jgi:quercetin dioxygenase-like cupin family protein
MKNILLIFVFIITLFGCSKAPNVQTESEINLADKVVYADKINNKVVFESDAYKMILFAIKTDQILEPHSAQIDAPLHMLEGSATITIENKEIILVSGDMIILPKDKIHGVYPITDCKFMLIK